jgi:Glycosyl transferase family 2
MSRRVGEGAPGGYHSLIVIPTRNRAELAINAIHSVLNQTRGEFSLLVSDNSTAPEEVGRLSEFCRQLSDERLRYIRPPEPLAMPEHWEWAMREGLSDDSVSHVAYLTDRMVFKSGTLNRLSSILARHPDKVISYNNDIVMDFQTPVILRQASWTGRLFELNTVEILAASSRVCNWITFSCVPRMLNCIVPREVLKLITARFGNLFLSTSPDLCFAYRCLERVDTILYYDKALLISYGQSRSNGASYTRGIITKDYSDFIANLDGRKLHYAAPVPEFMTGTNAVVHEYCFVKDDSQSSKFPEVNRKKYFESIAADIAYFENPQLKRELSLMLEQYSQELTAQESRSVSAKLEELAQKLRRLTPRWLVSTERPRLLWNLLHNRLGVELRGLNYQTHEFETTEEGLSYAERHPRAKNWAASIVETEMSARSLNIDSLVD